MKDIIIMRHTRKIHLRKLLTFVTVMNSASLMGTEAQGMDILSNWWHGKPAEVGTECNRPQITLILAPIREQPVDNIASQELLLDKVDGGADVSELLQSMNLDAVSHRKVIEHRRLKSQVKSQGDQTSHNSGNSFWASTPVEASRYLSLFDGTYNITLSVPSNRVLDASWSTFLKEIQHLDAIESRSGFFEQCNYNAQFFKELTEGLSARVRNLSCYDFGKKTSCRGVVPLAIWDDEALKTLATLFAQNKGLKTVNLGSGFPDTVSGEASMVLLKSLEDQRQLTHLDLGWLALNTKAASEQLAGVVQQATALQTLHIYAGGLKNVEKGMSPLCTVLKNHPSLTELRILILLSDCESVSDLLAYNSKIQKLSIIGFGPFTAPEHYKTLGEGLSKNKGLQEFEFELSLIDDKTTEALFQGMRGNTSLKKLSLDRVTLNEKGTQYLEEFLTNNTSLEDLGLPLLVIEDEQANMILKVLLNRSIPLNTFSFYYNGALQEHGNMWMPLVKKGTSVKFESI